MNAHSIPARESHWSRQQCMCGTESLKIKLHKSMGFWLLTLQEGCAVFTKQFVHADFLWHKKKNSSSQFLVPQNRVYYNSLQTAGATTIVALHLQQQRYLVVPLCALHV